MMQQKGTKRHGFVFSLGGFLIGGKQGEAHKEKGYLVVYNRVEPFKLETTSSCNTLCLSLRVLLLLLYIDPPSTRPFLFNHSDLPNHVAHDMLIDFVQAIVAHEQGTKEHWNHDDQAACHEQLHGIVVRFINGEPNGRTFGIRDGCDVGSENGGFIHLSIRRQQCCESGRKGVAPNRPSNCISNGATYAAQR